jgi:MFS family permease
MWSDAAMRTLSSASLLLNFFGMMCGAVIIPYLKRDFAASDAVVGYALGTTAIGAFAGSWLAGRVPAAWPFGRVICFAFLADALFFVPVALTHDLRIAVLFMAVSSGCSLFQIAQIVGWRMRVIPEHLVGRVFGAVRLVVLVGTVPGAIAGGALADRFGARVPVAVSCIGYLVMAVVIAGLPVVRRERR